MGQPQAGRLAERPPEERAMKKHTRKEGVRRMGARPRSANSSTRPCTAPSSLRADFHRIVYAENHPAAQSAFTAFERKWRTRCPGVVRSLHEGGEELLTFFQFPKNQWKTLRTTNVIERLHEEFRRRVKTQGSLPTEDAALVLLFGLVASGQIRLRRVDGWRQIPAVLSQRRTAA
jgi:Transposase, Mutator family